MKTLASRVFWAIIMVFIFIMMFGCSCRTKVTKWDSAMQAEEPERIVIYPAVIIHEVICKTSDNYMLKVDVTVQFTQDRMNVANMIILGEQYNRVREDIDDICHIFIGEIPKENLLEYRIKLQEVVQFFLVQRHKEACTVSIFYNVYNTPIKG